MDWTRYNEAKACEARITEIKELLAKLEQFKDSTLDFDYNVQLFAKVKGKKEAVGLRLTHNGLACDEQIKEAINKSYISFIQALIRELRELQLKTNNKFERL